MVMFFIIQVLTRIKGVADGIKYGKVMTELNIEAKDKLKELREEMRENNEIN